MALCYHLPSFFLALLLGFVHLPSFSDPCPSSRLCIQDSRITGPIGKENAIIGFKQATWHPWISFSTFSKFLSLYRKNVVLCSDLISLSYKLLIMVLFSDLMNSQQSSHFKFFGFAGSANTWTIPAYLLSPLPWHSCRAAAMSSALRTSVMLIFHLFTQHKQHVGMANRNLHVWGDCTLS